MSLALLLVLGCDPKIEPRSDFDSAGSTDVDAESSGGSSGSAESTSFHEVATTSPVDEEPCSASDTESPVESSTTYPGPTSDTDVPVETTTPTTSPGPTSDTESYSDSGETATEGPGEPETGVCGWGAGGDEAGSQCLLAIFQCGDLPKLEMKCDTVSCVCLEGGVQIGSCDADSVCDDLGSVQDKGPSCCGFPAVSP